MATRKKKRVAKKATRKVAKKVARKPTKKKTAKRPTPQRRMRRVPTSIMGIRGRGDEQAPLRARSDVADWERFVSELQTISNRPVALRIREWSFRTNCPVWEIITPELEFASGARLFTPPMNRGIGTTPREAVEDFMAFAAEAFSHRVVIAVFCRDDARKNAWAYYRWHDKLQKFFSCERPKSDPEPSRSALL